MPVKSTETNNGIMVIYLEGAITAPKLCPMPETKKAVEDNCIGVIFDLAYVDFINSAAISTLIENYNFLISKGIPTVLCSLNPHVLKVLRLSRTDTFIPVADDFLEAKSMIANMTTGKAKIKRENILVIQNRNNLRGSLMEIFKTAKQDKNYEIFTATTFDNAVDFLELFSINIVIIDITMPFEVIDQLVETIRLNRRTMGIPIYIATDIRNLHDASFHARNGADDIMHFPFNPYSTPTHLRSGLALYYAWREMAEYFESIDRENEFVGHIID